MTQADLLLLIRSLEPRQNLHDVIPAMLQRNSLENMWSSSVPCDWVTVTSNEPVNQTNSEVKLAQETQATKLHEPSWFDFGVISMSLSCLVPWQFRPQKIPRILTARLPKSRQFLCSQRSFPKGTRHLSHPNDFTPRKGRTHVIFFQISVSTKKLHMRICLRFDHQLNTFNLASP